MRTLFGKFSIGILLFFLSWGNHQLGAQNLAIVGGTLIDGTGEPSQPNVTVLIQEGRISGIFSATDPVPDGLTTIDAKGKYIIPGLIDTHAHYRDWQPEFFINHGVTTVLDLGNRPEWMQAIKEAVAKGKMKGPRHFRSDLIIQAPPDPQNTEIPRQRRGRLVYVRDVSEARDEARRQIEGGTDAIKIYAPLSPEQISAIVEEADKANIPVTGHILNAEDAILAGIDFIEHTEGLAISTVDDMEKYEQVMRERYQGDRYFFGGVPTGPALMQGYPPHHLMNSDRFEKIARLMAKNNAFLNPTLLNHWKGFTGHRKRFEEEDTALLKHPNIGYVPERARLSLLSYGKVDGLAPERREIVFAGYRRVQEFLKVLVREGGKVVAGVDATAIPGLGTHQEMFLLVDAGLTPMQALLSATLWSAEMMRKDDLLGSVEVGKLGDLVVLSRNPLEDINNTRTVKWVIKEGVIQDTEYHADFAIPIPRPDPSVYLPQIDQLTPRISVQGSQKAKILVEGDGFGRRAMIMFDGVLISTRYVDSGQLEGTISQRLLARVGTFPVTVQNPRPGGGVSNSLTFMVKFK